MPRQIPSQSRIFKPAKTLFAGIALYGEEAANCRALPFTRQRFARASDMGGSDSIQPWFGTGGAK